MDATTVAAAEAYKGTASIIQGVLIALSAIIAVVGYRVQASLNRAQHVRESALNDTKQLLKDVVGPAQGYAYVIDYMWLNFMCNVVWKDDDTVGKDDWRGAFSKVTGDPDAITSFMKGRAYMHMASFVGKEKEEEIKQNPTGYLAIEYRRFVRRLLRDAFKPMSILLRDFNIFPVPSINQFKKTYPYFANSFSLRKTIFLETLTFISELEYIVEQEWKIEKDYTKVFPISIQWNRALTGYLAGQVTTLKANIEALTDGKKDQDNHDTDPGRSKKERDRLVNQTNKAFNSKGSKYVAENGNGKDAV